MVEGESLEELAAAWECDACFLTGTPVSAAACAGAETDSAALISDVSVVLLSLWRLLAFFDLCLRVGETAEAAAAADDDEDDAAAAAGWCVRESSRSLARCRFRWLWLWLWLLVAASSFAGAARDGEAWSLRFLLRAVAGCASTGCAAASDDAPALPLLFGLD